MNSVWRVNIKTASQKGVNPREFCLKNNIVGIGWQIPQVGNISWDDYINQAKEKYKSNGRSFTAAIGALKHRMKVGDLCWTRNTNGDYYLGRITSDWRYDASPSNRAADVVNIRSCDWKKLGTVDVVPGKVVNSYISRSTVQRVTGMGVLRYSQYIANTVFEANLYTPKYEGEAFFSLISSDDCEDIVALYMQKELGFFVIPSSCKPSTASYEYVLKHSVTGEKAVAQVKRGNVNLNRDNYAGLNCRTYLLTTEGDYKGAEAENVVCLNSKELEMFARNNRAIMSDRVQNWLDYEDKART